MLGASTAVLSIDGRAGIGKSSLAVHAAHQLKRCFPDAQIYLNLYGSDRHPLSVQEVLSALLSALHETDDWLSLTLDKQIALYHSILVDKRVLIILDDVGGISQIEPLIPPLVSPLGSPLPSPLPFKGGNSGVLMTSRHRLESAAIANRLSLVDMNEDDGLYLLLRSSVGTEPFSMGVEAATQIVNLCSRNPLAVQLAARTLQDISSQQLMTYSTQLIAEKKKLASFNAGDLAVRACFSLAYEELSESCAKLFRKLGLFSQPTLTDTLAKVLLDSDLETARVAISHLVERRLLKPISQNCYQFQPLLRVVAKEKLAQTESSQRRRAVRLRIVQWYLKTAEERALVFHPTTRTPLVQRMSEQSSMLLQDGEQTLRLFAFRWFESERLNLMSCINWAYKAEAWEIVIQFVKHLVIFFPHGSHWQDWEQSHRLAIEAAQRLGDKQLEAQILNNLGNCFLQQSHWEKARSHYESSLSLLQAVGDSNGEAKTLLNLSVFYHLRQDEETGSFLRKTADEIRFANSSLTPPPSLPHKISQPLGKSSGKPSGRRHGASKKLETSKSSSSPTSRNANTVIGYIVAAIVAVSIALILS